MANKIKKLSLLITIIFLLSGICVGQNRNEQKHYEDSLMKATYKQMSDTKKGGARYYKELYDKTKNRVYLDSTQSVINRHRKNVDSSVMKRKQNSIQ